LLLISVAFITARFRNLRKKLAVGGPALKHKLPEQILSKLVAIVNRTKQIVNFFLSDLATILLRKHSANRENESWLDQDPGPHLLLRPLVGMALAFYCHACGLEVRVAMIGFVPGAKYVSKMAKRTGFHS